MERFLGDLLDTVGQIGVFLAAALVLAAVSRRSFSARWLGVAVLLILVHDFALTRGFSLVRQSTFFESDWNWLGKILAVAATLLIASLPAFGWRRSGLMLRQDPDHWRGAWIGGVLVAAVIVGLALMFGGEEADADTLAFQWTMPGLDEELFYRGVLLLALNEAFRTRVKVLGAPMGWGAVLTSVLFGLIHSLDYDAGAWSFDAMTALSTGGPALLLAWFREKSGSVVLPVLLHNGANAIPAMI